MYHPCDVMAAHKIGRKTPKEEITSSKRDKGPLVSSKCPVFTVQYLGKLPAGGEYGREYISEPVECLLKFKEKRQLSKTTLTVSEKGFHFLDQNGPFGKEKHVLIPLHKICYGVADEQSPCVFAIITRTDSNSDNSLFECHAFLCDKRKTSSEITYWLLRTFLQVFEELQKKRRLRQERKLQRRQHHTGNEEGEPAVTHDGRASRSRSSYSPDKPFERGSYSLILEGTKGQSAAVALKDRSRYRHSHNVTSKRNANRNEHHRRNNERDLNGNIYSMTTDEDIHPYEPQTTHKRHQQEIVRNTYSYVGGVHPQPQPHQPQPHQYRDHQHSYPDRNRAIPAQTQSPPPNSGSYSRHHLYAPTVSEIREASSIAQSTIHDDSDFLFIDLLQEEFTDGRHEVRSGRKGEVIRPPNQKLRSEDIERRIHEWLSAREELNDDISAFVEDNTSHPAEGLRRQFSRSDSVSHASRESYF